MSEHTIFISDKIQPPDTKQFLRSIQQEVNRWIVGHVRYGSPKREKQYMSRLAEELKAYRKNGNAEHLLNIRVYAYLETQAPENTKFHFNDRVESATRAKFGG